MSEEGEVKDVAPEQTTTGASASEHAEATMASRKREREEDPTKPSEDATGANQDDPEPETAGSSEVTAAAAAPAGGGASTTEATSNSRTRMRMERMVKILLTTMQAGALIGQAGAAVNELQKRTGTRIKVSNKTMFFPNTQLRIISVEGTDDQVRDGIKTIIEEVCFQESKMDSDTAEVFLAVPSGAAPIIIGTKGAKVNEINKETNAEVRVAKQSDEVPGVRERMITVKGKKDTAVAGVLAILDTMFKDASGRATTYENRTTTYEYRRDDYSRRDYRDDDRYRGGDRRRDDHRDDRRNDRYDSRGGGYDRGDPYRDRGGYRDDRYRDDDRRLGGGGPMVPLVKPAPGYSTQVSVPDEYVGAMLGRSGENLAEIQRVTRTRINVSRKGEYVPDTRDRIVTIFGAPQDCEIAKAMLAEKITKPS